MPHFTKGQHYLLGQKLYSVKENHVYLEIITCDPQYIRWTIPILYQTRRKYPLVQVNLESLTFDPFICVTPITHMHNTNSNIEGRSPMRVWIGGGGGGGLVFTIH